MEAARPPRWGRKLALAAGVSFVVGAGAIAIGPAAPWLIDHVADGQRVWRLGRIQVDGVEGSWLGNLRAAHISIADDEGVWVEAENVVLHWAPFSLLFGDVNLSSAHAARIAIARQPILSDARPSSGGGIDVRLTGVKVDQIELAEDVVGEAAQFAAGFELDLRGHD
ncbi:MAG TPA: hypothetical protein PLK37_10765, partial [Terricaulis sp.]|nr:hypothetical protein [Terricaulis sp.]